MLTRLLSLLAVSIGIAQPVVELNTTQYLGRWYQVYSDFFVQATFENSSYCVTADYGLYPNKTISVLNRERQDSVDGPERRILGWADTPNLSQPGQLQVHLQTTLIPAPYWVYELGPAVYNGSLYDYSIVSDPFKFTLFVLTRNLTRFAELYEKQVLETLTSLGFTTLWNTPLKTIQENCSYW